MDLDAVAPQRSSDGHAQRHLIECCFSKRKRFRRVATCFEWSARNDLAVVLLAATILALRWCPQKPRGTLSRLR